MLAYTVIMEANMVRTQIQLTEGQSSHLREIALAENVSIAELIRRSVDTYLQSYTDPSFEERKRNALSIIGIADSGLGDLSANHDVYLTDAYEEVGGVKVFVDTSALIAVIDRADEAHVSDASFGDS